MGTESKITAGWDLAASAGASSLAYLEQFYAEFRNNPEAVAPEWRDYFSKFGNGHGTVQLGPTFRPHNRFAGGDTTLTKPSAERAEAPAASVSDRLTQLIHNHRVRGHIIAQLDPLGSVQPCPPELALDFYHFSENELKLTAHVPECPWMSSLTVRETFNRLRDTYCRSIGAQYMHIDNPEVRRWLQIRMEDPAKRAAISRDQQLRILTRLTDAVVFEQFLRTKFLGAKTFSLEGCETLLPLLDLAIEQAGHQGVKTIILGMGHRGRLNVLAHIAGKHPCEIFREFADDNPESWQAHGDVKYHLGHSGDWVTGDGRNIHISLCFNPSHLEFVDPVVLGRTRAHQDRRGPDGHEVLGVMMHGDAAFAGEGVVQETLNLSKLGGYSVGGVLHVIVNNQIGFTTTPDEGRSTLYATDVARMLQVPIFHVNGEAPEAVAQVVQVAMDFRTEFKSDIFIDMYGYRRFGHNETDEPGYTQPALYHQIAARANVRDSYLKRMLEMKNVSQEEADRILDERRADLEQQLQNAKENKCDGQRPANTLWRGYRGGADPREEPATGATKDTLAGLLRKLAETPVGFRIHQKLVRGLEARRTMADGKQPLDWAAAEAMALGSLAAAGVRIRLTGQDSRRGTFSHRHAVLFDQENGSAYVPLQHVEPGQATVDIVNSPLCETAALGFEYGYSLDCPDGLIIWEAQFGDFVNAAQVIIDQFIISAEAKWRRLSGLVLLLPHGLEGMGPEHSSARLERFLALAADDNIQVAQPTTPAQYFHLLRRQALWKWRKPLIVFTPKSLLRHPKVVSALTDCQDGKFQRVLPDAGSPREIKRILLCTGKIFYELAAYREKHGRGDVAIIRLEQLYPLPAARLAEILEPYAGHSPVLWVQEEPANMGAWRFLHEKFGKKLFDRFPFALVSRPESPSPATGSAHAHAAQQASLLSRAFGAGGTQLHNGETTHERKGAL